MHIAQRDPFFPSGKLFLNYPIEMETSNCKYSKQAKNIHWGNPRLLATVQLSTSALQVLIDLFQLKKKGKNFLEHFFIDADKPEIEVQEEDNGIDNSIFNVQINNSSFFSF